MSALDWTKIISASVVPVVIISACGLLCLAFYSRLAAIVSRLRAFQRERLHEQEIADRDTSTDDADAARRRLLLAHLATQTSHVTRRAKLIRLTLGFLLLAIAMLIGCSLMLGLSILAPAAILIAGPLFLLGLLSMFTSTICAMLELKGSIEPAELESRFVTDMLRQHELPDEDDA